ncbi:MAG: RecX family transcriptional regulator [Sphingobacteriales bacterium]|nr:MAG: RecX family transcriptional regulator [Sphingobacteriales bacterium]
MTEKKKKAPLNYAEGLVKARRWCVLQERSHNEVKEKLFTYEVPYRDIQLIISELIGEGFLSEERFAKAYAGGKFRIKHWGKNKITQQLQRKGVSEKNIETGLKEIEEKDYRTTIKKLIQKKLASVKELNNFQKKGKLAQYLMTKGYEAELVWNILNDFIE